MKLSKRNMMLVSFMLFSLFFGAGNLIFPPFLGQMAGAHALPALLGFLVTAVVLPVLGVVAVAKYNGLQQLAGKVGPRFALVFTVLIYLSIGPGLGIPRAASVPFEMAIAPYLPENASTWLYMLAYSLAFFLTAGWLSLNPSKLVERVGKVLTPSLLVLLTGLFLSFLFAGKTDIAAAQGAYTSGAVVSGFLEGYNTMDAIAALNFGLVIATTLRSLHVEQHEDVMHYTVKAGIVAGTLLTAVYAMLTYMGMQSSGVYALQENGAWTLRCIVQQIFGAPGAVLLAAIFTLACLTTCVGLITSISQFFSGLTSRLSYRGFVFCIVGFSFAVCNQGLSAILSLSVPVLNAIYPVAIALIVLGLTEKYFRGNRYLFPATVWSVAVTSVLYSLYKMDVPMGLLGDFFGSVAICKVGMGWVPVGVLAAALSAGYYKLRGDLQTGSEEEAELLTE